MPSSITYGPDVPDESELRLCGDLSGRRVLMLGIGPPQNAIAVATAGAKTIVLDPSAPAIESLRRGAEEAEVRLECHVGELADLGFATSASIDVVLAGHTIDDVDDLARLLRQVHRVLRPEGPFVIALRHPVAAMFGTSLAPGATALHAYGSTARTFGDWFTSLQRTDFRTDVVHELVARGSTDVAPEVLVLRARKLGV